MNNNNSNMSSDNTLKKHVCPPWMEDLLRTFPLPAAPPNQCRDAYLKELLKSYKLPKSSTSTISSSGSTSSTKVRFGTHIVEIAEFYQAEAQLMDDFIKTRQSRRYTIPSKKSEDSRIAIQAPDIHKLLKDRYDNIANAIGFVSVLYQMQELKDRLLVVREMWSMASNVDKSLRMFSWSIKDYFMRFNLPNQIYLDTVEFELANTMDCFKFRMDLREIIRLVDALVDDVRHKRDICASSMIIIKDAEMDIMELLTKSQKDAEEQHYQITVATHKTPRSADPDRSRHRALYTKINYNDFYFPIEARYRISWAQTTMEQSMMYDDISLQEVTGELSKLQKQIVEIGYLWDISNMAYEMEITGYKGRINEMEALYEESLELVENEIQVTRNKLFKAKDDLKYHKEQIPMFHLKIAQVQELFAQQEAARQSSERKLRKSSRNSKLKKKSIENKKKK